MMGFSTVEVALGLGVLLVALEVVTGTFVFLSFGLGCFAVAGVNGATRSVGLGLDVAVFAVVSLVGVIVLRALFHRRGDSKRGVGDVNEY